MAQALLLEGEGGGAAAWVGDRAREAGEEVKEARGVAATALALTAG